MIDGSTIYVTTSSYGPAADNVYDFTLDGNGLAGAVTGYASLSSSTSGGQETGQLRGITYDAAGNIYYADSTWDDSGDAVGYLCEGTTCSAASPAIGSLVTPNELEVGDGTNGKVLGLGGTCDAIYAASYDAGTVKEYSTGISTSGTASGCGSLDGTSLVFLTLGSGLNVYGFALANGEGGTSDVIAGPAGLFALPEPGTWVLALSGLLMIPVFKAARRIAGKNSQA